MSVIWIIEPAGIDRAVARCLQGDFAVRVFASLESFRLLTRASRGPRPDLIVWHDEKAADAELLPDCPVLVLKPGDPRLADGFGFSAYVRGVLATGRRGDANTVLRYKDVALDFARLTLTMAASHEEVTLPLKEVQLLKLLMERAGATLTRDEISSHVWVGVKVTPRTIDSHVCRLRRRLKDAEIKIQGVYGDGYVLR